jgi:GTP-binding protein HflX
LEGELDRLRKRREQRRARRTKQGIPVLAIIGYTNAGKTTLFNLLTRSQFLVEDKLFATLDTATRRLRFPQNHEVVLTDTVGLIKDLPPDLMKAFRPTFDELKVGSVDPLSEYERSSYLHVQEVEDPSELGLDVFEAARSAKQTV